jgi:hypothetical protein
MEAHPRAWNKGGSLGAMKARPGAVEAHYHVDVKTQCRATQVPPRPIKARKD